MTKTKTKRGRDARTGQFIPVSEARRRKATAIVESTKAARPKSNKKRKIPAK